MTETWLSRLTLKRDAAAVSLLIPELVPEDGGAAMAMTHKLMWSVMPEEVRDRFGPGAARETTPFLWREAEPGRKFYLLGPKPAAHSPFFAIETRPYEPALAPSDRLTFDLRLNATTDAKVDKGNPDRRGRRRLDVAMAALVEAERGGADKNTRARRREGAAEAAARSWLEARGARDGYRLRGLALSGYRVERLPRSGSRKPLTFGVLDITGLIEVEDPTALLSRLLAGFGRAKAFGCGLMLIRRAP